MRSVISAVVGIALGLVLTTGALAADRPDSWVTAKTKLALMTTEGIDTWDLNVDTVNGVVTLHGKVGQRRGEAESGSRRAGDRRRQERQEPAPGRAEAATRGGLG